ncbi:cytochrome c oxidase subunit II [Sulfuricella denitrificans skB26]|uniref:Cytochrome c oxidase subunit 2 n=1 Tax=Sulfuricella denitrificans (strain DSM 22764 / NBRC 105220 / skB26) TaxID=1163617 RepID=S6AJE7_SULDS|nr:cytochrome c oxidase subunit II [Sulfuricella denitrificans]BAN36461.1 cytochrome c oxidase subunit II [Sulfuricella denitrificans skB26]
MAYKKLFASWAGFAAIFSSGLAHAEYAWNFPEPVTPLALDTLHVHNEFMLISIAIFLVVLAIMIYSIFTHRKSKGHQPANFTGPSTKSQVLWTLVPFAMLLFIDFVVMGIPAYHSVVMMEDTKTDADMVLKVTGSQWKWQYEYPAEGIKFVSTLTTPEAQIYNKEAKGEHYLLDVDNHVVLPVNKKVRILLTSTDVIHTWWVPQFGAKRDAIPGFMRETWARIEKPGIYRGQCAELCGKGHGFMPIVVEAVSEADYKVWVAQQKAKQESAAASAEKQWSKDDLMKQGAEVYAKQCVVCHQANGQGLPPTFPALAGSKLINGPMLDAGGRLVKDGHLDRVMNGKPGTAMQAFKNTLSDAEIAAVVTFERNSFGNKMGDMVQPAQAKALR